MNAPRSSASLPAVTAAVAALRRDRVQLVKEKDAGRRGASPGEEGPQFGLGLTQVPVDDKSHTKDTKEEEDKK